MTKPKPSDQVENTTSSPLPPWLVERIRPIVLKARRLRRQREARQKDAKA